MTELIFEEKVFTASYEEIIKDGFLTIMPKAKKCPAEIFFAHSINTRENTYTVPLTNDLVDKISIILIEEVLHTLI